MAQQPLVGRGLLITKASPSHSRHTTLGRIPLNEWSAWCRNLYLTTHSTHKRHVFVPPAGFEPAIPASRCLQTKVLNRAAAGISWHWVHTSNKFWYAWTWLWKLVMRLFFNNLDWGPVPRFAPWKHCSQCGLLYDSPFSKCSYFGRQVSLASPSSQRTNYGREMVAKLCLGYATRVLLHAANLRHGTDNFTSLPKEGVLRIFIAL